MKDDVKELLEMIKVLENNIKGGFYRTAITHTLSILSKIIELKCK